jgi:hypothetical protein
MAAKATGARRHRSGQSDTNRKAGSNVLERLDANGNAAIGAPIAAARNKADIVSNHSFGSKARHTPFTATAPKNIMLQTAEAV